MLRSACCAGLRVARAGNGAAAARFLSGKPNSPEYVFHFGGGLFPTADLCDKAGLDVSKVPTSTVSVVDPALNFRNFGGKTGFSGKVCTIKAFESNPLVRTLFESPGEGRVLVVDAGGSMRCAMLGDNIAEAGVKNGWAGIVIYGCIRDSAVISKMDIGVKALNTHPVKSHKNDPGLQDVPVRFGGVTIKPGQFLYADADGIVVSDNKLSV
mmetsp:Transcript_24064/g.57348  ORF Transcript_24064/g.57348 Transcript_24064/m.57348 type:complete len:211 (+) Transcript_24064:57-689(+)|eukprot:CAMPEP_0180136688 /NCGR_PEP_ID=MMETSP0986-20121125/11684_1 /TAXON_ID=697907 /ORGANISM="non described non described, Strain CCMP2293" /LENGTH=210 /DNA_ID=CAMNT_0022077843 /DNA_START=57 /DNA_END=689 /DNA_ORIENTATION=-